MICKSMHKAANYLLYVGRDANFGFYFEDGDIIISLFMSHPSNELAIKGNCSNINEHLSI